MIIHVKYLKTTKDCRSISCECGTSTAVVSVRQVRQTPGLWVTDSLSLSLQPVFFFFLCVCLSVFCGSVVKMFCHSKKIVVWIPRLSNSAWVSSLQNVFFFSVLNLLLDLAATSGTYWFTWSEITIDHRRLSVLSGRTILYANKLKMMQAYYRGCSLF